MLNLNNKDFRQMGVNFRSYVSYIFTSYSRPSHLVIELTAACNASCIMCDKQESLRAKSHMDYHLFKQIVIDAKKSNIKIFQLSFYGESLLYPKLVEAILYIRRLIPEAFITLITNGMLLTQKYAKKILDANIDSIVVSIDGNNKEEYERIRVGLKWDVLRENIINLRKLIDTNNYKTKIGIMGLNVNDMIIDKKLYKETWGEYFDTTFARNEHMLNDKHNEPIIHKLLPCKKLFSQMVIMTSGDVTRCDYDWEGKVVVGNIKNKTILELWTKSELSTIRLKHLLGLKRKLDLCNNCSYQMNDVFKKSNLT